MGLPDTPNDMNLYAGLIALGVGLLGCLMARYSNGGHGTRPVGDALSWFVHTRVGLAPKSWLARQLDLGVLLGATVGELLIVSIYVGWLTIRFAYFIEINEHSPSTAVRVGKAFGELGPPMILMEYLLAQRYTIWGWVAGIPHERLIGYHRIHGWSTYGVFFAHMVCMSVGMRVRIDGVPITRQLNSPMSLLKVNPQLGVAAFILWTFSVASTFNVFRRGSWGMFYAAHFSFVPAMSLTLFHNRPRNLPWLLASVGFFYVDAGVRFYMKFMRKSKVEAASVLPGGVVKLTISTGASMAYEAGQYVWLALPGLPCSEMLPSLSFHPYSISSAYAPGDKTYTLHIKNMGPGTWSEAVELAAAASGVDAFKGGCRIGGPAGRFSIHPGHFARIVLVAGGIGATPLMSLLSEIVREGTAKEEGGADGKKGGAPARHYATVTHVTLLWAVQSAPCLSWFTDALDAARAATGVTVDLQLFVTRAAKKDDASDVDAEGGAPALPAFKAGRPDVSASLAAVAAAAAAGSGPTGVFACGPDAMLEDTKRAVAEANASAASADKRFLLHTEVFLF
jgi:predicted ferric reductase